MLYIQYRECKMNVDAFFDKIVNKHKYKVNSIIKRMINEEIKHETLSNK
jgi:hypothetical protein